MREHQSCRSTRLTERRALWVCMASAILDNEPNSRPGDLPDNKWCFRDVFLKIKWLLVKWEVNCTHSTVWRMSIITWIKVVFNFNLLSGFAFQIISTNNKWGPFTLIGRSVLDKRHFWHMLFVDEDGDSLPGGHKKQPHYQNQTEEAQS